MTTVDSDKKIIGITLQSLGEGTLPTTEMIREMVYMAVEMLHKTKQIPDNETIEIDRLVREIETLCDVFVPTMSTLDDMRDHQEWLFSRRAEVDWRFWERYQRYLKEESKLPPQATRRLDEITDQILSRLENPQRPGPWDRRGMVVGQVQSGKTSNYTALICKAADAGYKLIVVLTGLHNSLRSQTQQRLDEGFLGFDTQKRGLFDPNNVRLGVGRLRGTKLYLVHSLTNSADKGDFSLTVANQVNVMTGGADPVLLVVKKNASVLKNLLKWATILQSSSHDGSHNQVHGIPLLLIDDEADCASINTNPILDENDNPDPEMDPTTINGLIRKLLNSFEQSAYIGYTATPFANIFITDKVTNKEFGEDLFPRSFIIDLQPPSNYFGPVKLFGLSHDSNLDQEDTSGLSLIHRIDDYTEWMPDKHKKDHQPGALPQSVKQAIKTFVLACAIRRVRGQVNVHNSMLIHVTRFTAVQSHITEQVSEELSFLQKRLRYGDGHSPYRIVDELREIWDTDFKPTMQQFSEPDLVSVSWNQVEKELYTAASKIEVRKINGTAKDALQYVEHKDGLSVICIGGDKLSRGLTLEGLSVSYYLRASKMYDTLMQMGRWFGYRAGYTDLCRLYTTSELVGWYRNITAADEELREMFEDMAIQEKTPEDYGLGVRKHPDGLMITAAIKMRSGKTLTVSYSNHIVETVVFFEDMQVNQQNLLATERLIQEIDMRYQRSSDKNYIWRGVPGEVILDFLADYTTHEAARTVQSSNLNRYIRTRIADHELVEWTIALISKRSNEEENSSFNIADLVVGLTKRHRLNGNDSSDSIYRIRRLVSPSDEWIDFSEEEFKQAIEETHSAWKKDPGKSKSSEPPKLPSGTIGRRIRPSKRGLLLLYTLKYDPEASSMEGIPIIGFAISFPESDRGEKAAVEYVANNVWQQELRGNL
ncbi:MAG: Z1 domain-containing protein [Ktedonobacteraceae bacterium]|nr:Z1 domain-containing protein [Ktedonobacteraceae bacterium]